MEPADVGGMLPPSRRPEEIPNQGSFFMPFSESPRGDGPGTHEGTAGAAPQAPIGSARDLLPDQILDRMFRDDVPVGTQEGCHGFEVTLIVAPPHQCPWNPLCLKKVS